MSRVGLQRLWYEQDLVGTGEAEWSCRLEPKSHRWELKAVGVPSLADTLLGWEERERLEDQIYRDTVAAPALRTDMGMSGYESQ